MKDHLIVVERVLLKKGFCMVDDIEQIDRRVRARKPDKNIYTRLLHRLASLIMHSDTTPTRFMLALAASVWAVMLYLPGDTFDRPVYVYMKKLVGDHAELKWAIAWTMHALGMWWRTFSSTPRPAAALVINSLGVLLFCGSAIAIYLALTYPVPAAVASDFVLALASFWVLVRTTINSEHGWRVD